MTDVKKHLHNGGWYTLRQIADMEGFAYERFRKLVNLRGLEYAVKYYRNKLKPNGNLNRLTWNGETKPVKAWAQQFGIHTSTLRRWLRETDLEGAAARAQDENYRKKRFQAINALFGSGSGQKSSICWDCAKQEGGCVWSRTLKAKPEGAVFVRKTAAANYDIEICTSCPEFVQRPKRENRDTEQDGI